jgi:cytochrome P450
MHAVQTISDTPLRRAAARARDGAAERLWAPLVARVVDAGPGPLPAHRDARTAGTAHPLPPGPDAPPLAQLVSFLYAPIPFLDAARARYGRAFTLRLPGVPPVVQFSDPDAVRQVFAATADAMHAGEANAVLEPFLGSHSVLVLDGTRHHVQRRLLLPPFRGERMRAYGEAMRDLTRARMANWPLGPTFRVQPETQAITLDVILRTVFGMETGASQDRMRRLLLTTLAAIDSPLYLVRAFQRDAGPLSPWGRFLRKRAEVHRELDALIERTRARGDGDSILAMLLQARHEDGTPMSDAEIRDELVTLLVAGHETTATALSWTLHRLSRHPEVLREVQTELDRVAADGLEPDGVRELPYLDAVCKESLRIHPVVPGVGRVLKEPARIGGYDLPAGVVVGCSIYLVHTDPEVWPDPRRFDPQRFLHGRPAPGTYFPFGGGLRRCIGEAFALYEMRVVLATILRELEPLGAGTDVRAVRRAVTLVPSDGLPLRFRRRTGR